MHPASSSAPSLCCFCFGWAVFAQKKNRRGEPFLIRVSYMLSGAGSSSNRKGTQQEQHGPTLGQPLQTPASRDQGSISPFPPAGSLCNCWGHWQSSSKAAPGGYHRPAALVPKPCTDPSQSACVKCRVCTQTWHCGYPFNLWYFRSPVG